MERYIIGFLIALWPLSEMILGIKRRALAHKVKSEKSSYRLIWIVIILSISSAMLIQYYMQVRIPGSNTLHMVVGAVCIISGLLLRWVAIWILGKSFVVDVAFKADQILIKKGPYAYIRHPSYTGMLISFLGLGILFGNWVGLFLIMVPITTVLVYRIRSEEELLLSEFGEPYSEYSEKTWRLFPGIY